jgi:hypothetical protein
MDRDDFWSGVRLVVTGLADAAKQASYSLGFGAGGLGGTLLALNRLGVTGVELTLIAMSAFFIAARIGKALDSHSERASLQAKIENDLKLKRKLEAAESRYSSYELYELRDFVLYRIWRLVEEESRTQREEIFWEVQRDLVEEFIRRRRY